jgi:transposase
MHKDGTVTTIICGVDVSSATLDASLGRNGPWRKFPRTPEGIAELARFCREHRVELVAMEASGGYERLPYALLWEEGIPCAIANPRHVRRFAEAMGFLEKTDRIDSGMISEFAAAKKLVAQPPPTELQERLVALTARLRQVTMARVALKNQRRLVKDAFVLASIEEAIAFHKRQIAALEQAIADLMRDDALWVSLSQAFRTIKGVADRTVTNVLALMPEIGTLSNKAVAKLAGLAPMANDTGKRSGPRPVRGGRASLRSCLVFVAGIVAKHDPDFARVRARLTQAGKEKRAIRVALARKLLVRLNAKARDIRRQLAAGAAAHAAASI